MKHYVYCLDTWFSKTHSYYWGIGKSAAKTKHNKTDYNRQYQDLNQIATQIELRRTILVRHGVTFLLGMGNYQYLFHTLWLPTIGVVYSFAFKAKVNVCIDLEFGKDTSAPYFNVNEAF